MKVAALGWTTVNDFGVSLAVEAVSFTPARSDTGDIVSTASPPRSVGPCRS